MTNNDKRFDGNKQSSPVQGGQPQTPNIASMDGVRFAKNGGGSASQHKGAQKPDLQGSSLQGSNPQSPNPQGSSPQGPNGLNAQAKSSKKVKIIALVIVLVLLAAGIAVGVAFCSNQGNNPFDSNALSGQAPYKTQEEMQAELDRVVEEGMFNISIASVIEFEDGTSEGTAYIENVPGNRYVMKVDITLDDSGEVVYSSGGIKPDQYIENIKLMKDLDAGSYPATATFQALDPDSLEEIGQAAAKITLNVLN